MTTGTDVLAAVVGPLEAAGLRVSVNYAELVPPSLYVAVAGADDGAGTLAAPLVVALALWYVPVRGIDNPAALIDAIAAATRALRPVVVDPLAWRAEQLTADPAGAWLAWRADLIVHTT